MIFSRWVLLIFKCLFLLSLISCSSNTINPQLMGGYRMDDGRIISIRKSEGNTLRYRIFQDGRTGRLYPNDQYTFHSGPGFSAENPIEISISYILDTSEQVTGITWQEKPLPESIGKKINQEQWIKIQNQGLTLNARINLPEGNGPFPAVVLVHGSGKDKATDYYPNGDFFAAQGIAALTFDKRGTGDSEGIYTFDYYKLASDVIAGVEYLQSRQDILDDKIGLSGYSQGGWVAPLAASLSDKISFVIVNYGMIESAIEEAILETRNTLRSKGVKEESLKEVDELTLATVNVVASNFNEGWDLTEQLDKKYKDASWRKELEGTTVHEFLKYPKWIVKWIGPGRAPNELDWNYESTPILEALSIPVTWLLAENDIQAPNELTIPKIIRYQQQGKKFDLHIFPHTDHGILMYEEVEGRRVYTQYSPDYFKIEIQSVFKMLSLDN